MKQIILSILAFVFGNSSLTACSSDKFQNMNVEEFAAYIAATPNVVVLDVRTPEEFAAGHLPNAVNINVQDADFLEKSMQQIPMEKPIAVYCRSGRRSAAAAERLAAKGFKVTNMTGGILDWQKKQMPIQ